MEGRREREYNLDSESVGDMKTRSVRDFEVEREFEGEWECHEREKTRMRIENRDCKWENKTKKRNQHFTFDPSSTSFEW